MTIRLLCPNCREKLDLSGGGESFFIGRGALSSMKNCREPLDENTLSCANGHRFSYEDGVLVLLEEAFSRRLAAFLAPFSQLRAAEGRRLSDPTAYPLLPYGEAVADELEWRLRRYDLAVVNRLLRGRLRQRVLDIGAWNGWLSHRLATMGHEVTAIDYFVDEYDGLRARKFYPTRWLAIQMNLEDLDVLDQQFDVVIVNRCLQFFADPASYAAAALEKVASGGLLVLTGLAFLRDPRHRIEGLAELRSQLHRHGLDFFKPMKGYLDLGDRARLQALGVALRPYPQLWRANLKALLIPTAPRYAYGILPC